MQRAAAEKARKFIKKIVGETADDSAITISSSSYADDDSLLIEGNSSISEVFNSTDDSPIKEEITKSASETKVASVFTFERVDESFKSELNRCGKRFERTTGSRIGKNKIENVKPVSETGSKCNLK